MSTVGQGSGRPAPETRCPVSVVIAARDEETQLPTALGSVASWAGEVVVVVDPLTVDRSREVAAAAGARVLEHRYVSSSEQYNWALRQARHRWGLVLDADERASGDLGREVAAALAEPSVAAYSVRRVNFAFGQRLRFGDWGRDRIVRLLDRESAAFEARAVHGAVRAPSIGRLGGHLEHHSMRSLEQYVPKVYDYARRGAADMLAAGRRSGPVTAVARAEWRFLRAYVLRLGFLDGMPGLIVAVLAAHGTFLKWSLVWQRRGERGVPPPAAGYHAEE